jgi:DNA-directed RNA polymerase specialized sigma24 family protein
MRASMAVGRVPSVIRDIKIRGKVSTYQLRNFEDVVVFVVDVDRCLAKLDETSQQAIVRIALQEYSYEEAANLLGMSLRSTARIYAEALDRLTATFLEKKLLQIGDEHSC